MKKKNKPGAGRPALDSHRDAFLHLRLHQNQKAAMIAAADIEGMTLTEYVISAIFAKMATTDDLNGTTISGKQARQ